MKCRCKLRTSDVKHPKIYEPAMTKYTAKIIQNWKIIYLQTQIYIPSTPKRWINDNYNCALIGYEEEKFHM